MIISFLLSRNDAVGCGTAPRRHAGFSNEIGTATSAGPTFTAGSGQLTRMYSSNASIPLSRIHAVERSSRGNEAEREVTRIRQPRYLGCYEIPGVSTASFRL